MLINLKKKTNSFDYFFQRFENGRCITPHLPRITTEESVKQFQPRDKGLKVLLINVDIRNWSYPNIEGIGQLYIASSAIVDGHKVYQLDLNGERKKPVNDLDAYKKYTFNRVETEINKISPDIIGIGGIITQFSRIKEITNLCKTIAPNIPIVLGGGISTPIPKFCLERLNVDYVILEEGEISFSELLFRIENKLSMDNCLGVAFKKNNQITINPKRPSAEDGDNGLNHLNWPARHLVDIENVYKINPVGHLNIQKWNQGKPIENKYSLSILGTRGCPYDCAYCFVSYLSEKYRRRTPKDIVDEMEYLKNRYNLSYLHFLDDLYLTDYKWSFAFFEELNQRKLATGFEIEWGATCRSNIIADDIVRAQKQNRKHMIERAYEVGMRQVCMGIESASDKVLKAIDKSGQTQEKIKLALKEVKRIYGYTDPSLMIGNPSETEETIRETIDVMKEINADTETVFYTTAFPGTPFWDLALEKGLIHKCVKGYVGVATDNIIEEYFMMLGENSEKIRTNFSTEISDQKLEELGAWMTQELKSLNKRHPGLIQEPHTGDVKVKSAHQADL